MYILNSLRKFFIEYLGVTLMNRFFFHIVGYSEIFFILLLFRFFRKSEIDISFLFEVLMIYISGVIFVILPLGGYKGIKEKFEKNFKKEKDL